MYRALDMHCRCLRIKWEKDCWDVWWCWHKFRLHHGFYYRFRSKWHHMLLRSWMGRRPMLSGGSSGKNLLNRWLAVSIGVFVHPLSVFIFSRLWLRFFGVLHHLYTCFQTEELSCTEKNCWHFSHRPCKSLNVDHTMNCLCACAWICL